MSWASPSRFGWTPCIGPILAAILAVASSEESVGQGAVLLAAYSLGLGLPFLLAALAMEPFIHFLRRFKAHFGKVERAVGVLLVPDRRAVSHRRPAKRKLLAVADLSGAGEARVKERTFCDELCGERRGSRPSDLAQAPACRTPFAGAAGAFLAASRHSPVLWRARLTWRLRLGSLPPSMVIGATAPLAAILEATLESARYAAVVECSSAAVTPPQLPLQERPG